MTTYHITNWTELAAIDSDLSGDYILDNNLNNQTSGFDGLGNNWTPLGILTGTFDGQGFEIQQIIINKPANSSVGLFSRVNGTVTNLRITGKCIGNSIAGLLVGENTGIISKCSCYGTVSGVEIIGGLVGRNSSGQISDCYSECLVSITGYWVGGLVGQQSGSGALLTRCYSISTVSGDLSVGGLIGQISGGTITRCFSISSTTGNGNVGVFLGRIDSSPSISNNYWWNLNDNLNGVGSNPTHSGTQRASSINDFYFTGSGVGGNVYSTWNFSSPWSYTIETPRLQLPNYWIADSSGDWSDSSNWSLNKVPDKWDRVIFNDTHVGDCSIDVNSEVSRLLILSGYSGSISHDANFKTIYYTNLASPISYNYLYAFNVEGVNLSSFVNPEYPTEFTIKDMLSEFYINTMPLGTLNSPEDIIFSHRLQNDFIIEFPNLGVFSPKDILTAYCGCEIPCVEINEGIPPIYVVNSPLDITMGQFENDRLFYNLVLVSGGGETSWLFV